METLLIQNSICLANPRTYMKILGAVMCTSRIPQGGVVFSEQFLSLTNIKSAMVLCNSP